MPDVKPLQKVLIANRGEIAVRVIRACKDAGISSVAVYADPDRDALFVRLADEAHSLGGATPADSYLDIEKIVAAAEKSGADSVHPGYGFLAENRDFAQAVIDAGLVWIGPPPEAIENLGDKVKARHIAEKVGAPLAPGTKDPLENADQAVEFAEENGLPIAIKAAFGGGGRGLKIARKKEEVADAFESAVREAESAFGRGECFVEKFLDKPRHVETQCLADQHGNVVVISTRDCSLQRRNQKLVEEAPAPFLTDDQVSRLYESSKAILREADYVGAGTCEFLVAEDGTISFLEVNTRLQVEHCVSEEVTGIDLVREMFRIAAGEELGYADPEVDGSLHRVPDQRRGRRRELHARPRHPDHVGAAVRPGHPRRRRLRGGRDHPRRLRLADRQADRHRPRPHPGARALTPRAGRVPRRRHADGDPVPRRGGRATRPSSAPRPRSPRSSSVYTQWIETDFDNQIAPYGGDNAEAPEPDERNKVTVEVGGRRLEVVLPVRARLRRWRRSGREEAEALERQEGRRCGIRRLRRLPDAGHDRQGRRRGGRHRRGGRRDRRTRGDEDGAAAQGAQGRHGQRPQGRGRLRRHQRRSDLRDQGRRVTSRAPAATGGRDGGRGPSSRKSDAWRGTPTSGPERQSPRHGPPASRAVGSRRDRPAPAPRP